MEFQVCVHKRIQAPCPKLIRGNNLVCGKGFKGFAINEVDEGKKEGREGWY